MRPTIGSCTPSGNETRPTLEEIVLSASSMSTPNSNSASTRDRFSDETDCTPSIPFTPDMAASIGAVTSRATASGLADG